jgi:hypothetical protein
MTEALAIQYLRTFAMQYGDKGLDYPEVRNNYTKIMSEFADAIVQECIDNLIKVCKYCPKPAEVYEECKRLEKIDNDNRALLGNQDYCYVCDNTGVVCHRTKECDISLYCTECEKGQENKYDGRQCKKKSDYYISPVTKYYDIEELKARNMFNAKNKGVPVPMPDTIRKLLGNLTHKWGA